MNKILSILLLVLLTSMYSCKTTTYVDKNTPLKSDDIKMISIQVGNAQDGTFKSYTISDKSEVLNRIEGLNKASLNGPWKGAQWDRIELIYTADTITLLTNGEVFGLSSSEVFYELSDELKTYWKK